MLKDNKGFKDWIFLYATHANHPEINWVWKKHFCSNHCIPLGLYSSLNSWHSHICKGMCYAVQIKDCDFCEGVSEILMPPILWICKICSGEKLKLFFGENVMYMLAFGFCLAQFIQLWLLQNSSCHSQAWIFCCSLLGTHISSVLLSYLNLTVCNYHYRLKMKWI